MCIYYVQTQVINKMTKKIIIKQEKTIKIDPEFVYNAEVKKSGNGAVINSLKKFIGKKATVVIKK